jgi:hypothetical protein
MVASSSNIKFWSAPPPRTLNQAPSPALVTPSNRMDFKTSTSPKTTGIFFMVEIEFVDTHFWFSDIGFGLLSVITTSFKAVSLLNNLKLFLHFDPMLWILVKFITQITDLHGVHFGALWNKTIYSFVVTPVFFSSGSTIYTIKVSLLLASMIVPLSVNFSCAKSVIEQKIGLK